MTSKETVKSILLNDLNKIVHILEALGCYKINPHFAENEIRCSLPDGTNATSVSIITDTYIPVRVFSRGGFDDYEVKDIITLVQFIRECNFYQALDWLCKKLGVENESFSNCTEEMSVLQEVRRVKRRKKHVESHVSHDIISSNVLRQYHPCIVSDWITEGLDPVSQKKYGILDDESANRWLIPVYDENDNLISLKGRTYAPNWEEMGTPKFIYYQKLGVNDILFGLNYNKNSVIEHNEIILFEAEKSVIAADSYGCDWCASLGTNSISKQLKRKILSLKCSSCVLAFDKDVSWNDACKEAYKLNKYMNVYIVFDKQGILTNKQSPTDAGKETWELLYKTKIRVR